MKDRSEIVIIGGGINGVSTAFHLAKHGASVALLEKDFIWHSIHYTSGKTSLKS